MLLTPHAGLIVWTIVTFVIVLLVLKATVWKPLLGALEEHQKLLAGAEA
jgi:F-type H+-transporting ATPase subunit b